MEKALIYINYPELIPLTKPKYLSDNSTDYEYGGYITIDDKYTYRIKLQVPNFPDVKDIKCDIPSLTDSFLSKIKDHENHSTNIVDYLNNVTKTLTEHSRTQKHFDHDEFFFTVFKEYQQLCQNTSIEKIKANKEFKTFKIKYRDSGGRFHYLAIHEDNKLFKLTYYDIPKISNDLLKEYESLNELFTAYCNCIEELQTYFDVMDSIDTVCWVIDPLKPKKSDYMRRIMIGHNVSIQITFDPLNILNLPQIQFMGSENNVAPFRENFINNLDNWDPEYDVVQNILRLIDIFDAYNFVDLPFFPQEPVDEAKSNDLDFKVNECCICFCVQLDNKLPDEICKNPHCEQCFHTDCLYQWLSAIGTIRKNFNLIQGECPNCKTCITCRTPNI